MSREKVCEICGSTFTCGAPGPCWCSSVHTDRDKRNMLAMVASDCVCRECLAKLTK